MRDVAQGEAGCQWWRAYAFPGRPVWIYRNRGISLSVLNKRVTQEVLYYKTTLPAAVWPEQRGTRWELVKPGRPESHRQHLQSAPEKSSQPKILRSASLSPRWRPKKTFPERQKLRESVAGTPTLQAMLEKELASGGGEVTLDSSMNPR